jgi:hypothetical protein
MTVINEMDKLCSGCLIYKQYKKHPKDNYECEGYKVKDKGCPCIQCLLKMMCTTTCKEIEERKWPIAYNRRYRNE